MKSRNLIVLFVALVILGQACRSAEAVGGDAQPTITEVAIRPATSDAATTPYSSFLVREGTPAPISANAISSVNIEALTELARWGRGAIRGRTLSEDGTRLFAHTASDVRVYDAASKELLWRVEIPSGIGKIAISEAGGQVAVGDTKGDIWLLDINSGAVDVRWSSNGGEIDELAFSDDGHWLVSGWGSVLSVWHLPQLELAYILGRDDNGSAMKIVGDRLWVGHKLYDLASGDLFYDGWLYSIQEVFPEADWFIVRQGQDLSLRDLQTGESINTFELGAELYAGALALSPDHTRLVGVLDIYRFSALVWDTETGQLIDEIDLEEDLDFNWDGLCYGDGGGPGEFFEAEFTSEMMVEIVSGYEETIYWDFASGEVWTAVPPANPAIQLPREGLNSYPIGFSPDGKWLLSGEVVWDLSSGQPKHFIDLTLLGFSQDGTHLYAYQDKAIQDYSVPDFELVDTFPLGEESRGECSYDLEISPDGSLFFEGGYMGGDSYASFLWGLSRETPSTVDAALYDIPRLIVFTPDGQKMVVLTDDWYEGVSAIDVRDMETGNKLFSLNYNNGGFPIIAMRASISEDSDALAVMYDEAFVIWDLRDPLQDPIELPAPTGFFWDEVMALSPDGKLVAVNIEGGIVIWDVSTQTIVRDIRLEGDAYVCDLVFSPDGNYLAAYALDGAVHLFGIPGGE